MSSEAKKEPEKNPDSSAQPIDHTKKEEKHEEEEEESSSSSSAPYVEEKVPKVNHYIPDPENPYNNMNMENPEISEIQEDDYTVICWYCKKPIIIKDGWNMFECGNCHRMNRLPRKLINELYFEQKLKNIKFNDAINHLDKIIPIVYIIVHCPYCKASNKCDKNANRCKCFVCERCFNLDKNEEDVKPIDQISLNPNSKYYKYKDSKFSVPKRLYPPSSVYRVSEFCFPEPVNYDNDFYFNNGLINKIYFSDFQYNKNHQLQFQNPYRSITPSPNIISKSETEQKINGVNNLLGVNMVNSLKKSNEMRQSEKSKLYSNLFFMK